MMRSEHRSDDQGGAGRDGRHARLSLALGVIICLLAVPVSVRADEPSPQPPDTAPGMAADAPQQWNFHAQTTVIGQGTPSFRSPYQGENSLNGGGQTRETWTLTPSLGLRFWRGGEFYINPELFQGFGISGTHGIAGFANGDAQKGGTEIPEVYLARMFFRQTFGLGGETGKVADDYNQLAGMRDVARITVTAGKFAVTDIFDDNTYAHDPRVNFKNWSIYTAGAFDYAADQKGYVSGMVVDFNQKSWAMRGGYFLEPIHSNANTLDEHYFERGQYVLEFEKRYSLNAQPGKLRLLGWMSRANAGSYRQALADPNFDGDLSIDQTHAIRTKYGFVINLEQAITGDLGVFSRLSWADGQSETMSFTDIDASISGGLSLKGTAWGRPKDTVGLAGAINGLSAAHRDFTAAGGLGVLIGDGRLRYGEECILETFYSWQVRDPLSITFDYQFITNPAYNADRGPVSVIGTRLHAQF